MTQVEKVETMFKALFVDQPSQPSFASRLRSNEEAIKRFSDNSSRLVWVGVGLLGAVIVDVIRGFIK